MAVSHHRGPGSALTGPLYLKANRTTNPHVSATTPYVFYNIADLTNASNDPDLSYNPRVGSNEVVAAAPWDMALIGVQIDLDTAPTTTGSIEVETRIGGSDITGTLGGILVQNADGAHVQAIQTDMSSYVITAGTTFAVGLHVSGTAITTDDIAVTLHMA